MFPFIKELLRPDNKNILNFLYLTGLSLLVLLVHKN